jgi:hypothetical protein
VDLGRQHLDRDVVPECAVVAEGIDHLLELPAVRGVPLRIRELRGVEHEAGAFGQPKLRQLLH